MAVLGGLARAAEIEPFIELSHHSDPTAGRLSPHPDALDLQSDFLGSGLTITAGKRRAWEMDVALGVKKTAKKTANGGNFNLRFYPRRLR